VTGYCDAIENERTYLYRIYGRHRLLLYVGIALEPERRLQQHCHKRWYPDVAEITMRVYPTRTAAGEAEQRAVKAEQPVWNSDFARDSLAAGRRLKYRPEWSRQERLAQCAHVARLTRAAISFAHWRNGKPDGYPDCWAALEAAAVAEGLDPDDIDGDWQPAGGWAA